MKIAQLFGLYSDFQLGDNPMKEVSGISIDSRQVEDGNVFVAMKGHSNDSHDFLSEVCKHNLAGLVVEDLKKVPTDFTGSVLKVPESRAALVRLASRYFDEPAKKLFTVGITGTNGKTSTAYLVEHLLNAFGIKTGVMGTIDHHIDKKKWTSQLTTPDAVTLQKRLSEFVDLDGRAAVMEVSSHALNQQRATGVSFDSLVFTNLSRDHLDYHSSLEEYFQAKEKLFSELPLENSSKTVRAMINANDEWGMQLVLAPNVRPWTYGEVKSDFQFQIKNMSFSKTTFLLNAPSGQYEVEIPLPGRHNVYNCVAAFGVALAAGASLDTCISSIKNFSGIPGRLQRVPSKSTISVFVDYAHTDEALKVALNLLASIRGQSQSKSKIITIFGCGGDRDKGKRELMAKAAVENSDGVWITSDNPRTEEPMAIIQDILKGVPNRLMNQKVFVEVDRREAIRKAIEMAGPKDVVLIAGKGHENYQIIGEKHYDFSDLQVAGEILNVM